MLSKITFTPDHTRYDAVELLDKHLTKTDVSLNFLKELSREHDIQRLAELFILPLEVILSFKEYRPADIHYLLTTSKNAGIQFGSLPDWYAEAISKTDKAETLRFLHFRLNNIRWPYTSPTFNRDAITFLSERGIDRVYQFLLINKDELTESAGKLSKKVLDSYQFFIESNELDDLKITVNPVND